MLSGIQIQLPVGFTLYIYVFTGLLTNLWYSFIITINSRSIHALYLIRSHPVTDETSVLREWFDSNSVITCSLCVRIGEVWTGFITEQITKYMTEWELSVSKNFSHPKQNVKTNWKWAVINRLHLVR